MHAGVPLLHLGAPWQGQGRAGRPQQPGQAGWVSAGLSLPSGTLWGPKPLPPPISIFRSQGGGRRILAQGVRVKPKIKGKLCAQHHPPAPCWSPQMAKGQGTDCLSHHRGLGGQHRHSFLPLEHCEPGLVLPQYTPKVAGRNSQCLTVNKTLKVSEKSEINRKSCDSGPGIPHSKDPENEAKTRLQIQPQAFGLLLNPDVGPQASERTGHPTSSCPSRAPTSAAGLTSSIFTWPPHPP